MLPSSRTNIFLCYATLVSVDLFRAQPSGFQGQQSPFQVQQSQQPLGSNGQPFGGANGPQPGGVQSQQFFPQQGVSQFGQQPPLGSQMGVGGVQPAQQSNNFMMGSRGLGAGVKIVDDLLPFERASHTSEIRWMEPFSSQIYCVGQSPVQELRFTCATCGLFYANASFPNPGQFGGQQNFGGFQQQQQLMLQQQNQVDQMLAQYTRDFTGTTQYPAIKLMPMPISGEMWDKQRIQCIGYYPGGQVSGGTLAGAGNEYERPNVTIDSMIYVTYVGKPQILDQSGRRPIFTTLGQAGRFYAPVTTGVSLKCDVRANPPATAFQWRLGSGMVISQSQTLQIPGANLVAPASFSCRATNAAQQQTIDWKSSDEVIVEQLVGPYLTETNFETVSRSGVKESNTGKVQIGRSATLQCTAASSSRPFIFWYQQSAPGRIVNASCDGGPRTGAETQIQSPPQQQQQGGQNVQQAQQQKISVSSTCTLTFDTFMKSGDYWCLACSYIAENFTSCHVPNTNLVPPGSINFELQGPPYISPYYKVDNFGSNSKQVGLTFTYCADPLPKTNEVFFLLDNEKLYFNNKQGSTGIQAGPPVQNQTYSKCQDVQLTFDNGKSTSILRSLSLNIEPTDKTFAPVQQQYNVRDALTSAGQDPYANTHFDATALAVGLTVGLVALVAMILLAYCWYKKCCCFAPRNARPTKPVNKGNNSGPSSKPATKYQAGIPSSQLRTDLPPEKIMPLTRQNNGFDRPTKTAPHEGMTYSEFDLVKDSNRLVPAAGGRSVVEYSRMPSGAMQNPASIKSPTNSIV